MTKKQNRPPRNPCHPHLHVKILAEGSLPGTYGFYSSPPKMDRKWQLKTTTRQDSNTFFTSLKGVGCIFENNRKAPLPLTTLAKQKPADKSTNPKCSDTLIWAPKQTLTSNLTRRTGSGSLCILGLAFLCLLQKATLFLQPSAQR